MTCPAELIPHRGPMLLIDEVVEVGDTHAAANVRITPDSPFLQPGTGVPAWIGIEYMGQTAALIAGHLTRSGSLASHTGFLLGTRRYQSTVDSFTEGQQLRVECRQSASVGESLATFACMISDADTTEELASCSLSVFRKPAEQARHE